MKSFAHNSSVEITASSPRLVPIRSLAEFESFVRRFTSYEHMKDFRYGRRTMRLERMESFLADLGSPHSSQAAIHVAGTKGKGTTCLMLEALLAAGDKVVGTYLSPHVEFLSERIRRGGAPIDEAALCDALNSMLDVLESRRKRGTDHFPTFFELMTALAMYSFRGDLVDHAIYEVGLGGRLDATNILSPAWTAITSIGLEHTQKLGPTLARIAAEKAGIVKGGVPVVLGAMPAEARRVIIETAEERSSPVIEAPHELVRFDPPDGLLVEGFGGRLPSGAVRGPGLRSDLAVAVTLWSQILASEGREPRREELRSALESLGLPARIELFDGDPPVVLDGAHTTESIGSLATALEEMRFPAPRCLVFSIATDKRLDPILKRIHGLAREFVLTRCDPVRSVDPHDLEQRFRSFDPDAASVTVIDDPGAAFDDAVSRGLPVVVTGSMYLAGTVRSRLRGRNTRS